MKKEFIVFILLISAFLAIGCTGYNPEQEPTAPVNETSAVPTNETTTITESKTVEVSSKILLLKQSQLKSQLEIQ